MSDNLIAAIVFASVGVLTLVAFCVVRGDMSSIKAVMLKTATSMLFLAVAISFAASNLVFMLILGGLIFGMLGDIFLDLKFLDVERKDQYTFAGMGVFAAGHILYIIAIDRVFDFVAWHFLVSAGIAAVFAVLVMVVTIKLMKFKYEKFFIPAVSYAFLLTFFTALCVIALIISGGQGGRMLVAAILLCVGSVMFLLSDVILSMTYFGGKKGKLLVVTNHLTYYAAQFSIAFSLYWLLLAVSIF